MSIQIIDGFQVNTALPIDNRIVASGSTARNAISFKYHGLRVFDISNNIPYVWNGSSWISENSSGIIGSGTLYYFPIFSSSNVISNSLLYEYNGIIKTADNGNGDGLAQIDPEYGTISAQGGFYGPGSNITNISGSNINNGSIPVSGAGSKLINGSTGQVLVSGVTNPSWTNQSLLSVGTASSSLNSNITRVPTGTGIHYLTFIGSGAWSTGSGIGAGVGNEVIRANNADLSYIPGARTLSVGTVSSTRLIASSTITGGGDINAAFGLSTTSGIITLGGLYGQGNAMINTGSGSQSTAPLDITRYGNNAINFRNGTSLNNRLSINTNGTISISSLNSGTVYSASGVLTNTAPSDFYLKKNIEPIKYGLKEILQLNAVSFDWKEDPINQGKQFGFIAQEVQEIIPEFVKSGEYLGLDKEAIFTVLIKAFQEQQAQIEELKSQVESLINKNI
jgi:hypothetical protein